VTLQTAAAAAAVAANDDDDDDDKSHVVNILVQMQRQVESNVGLRHVSQLLQLLHNIQGGSKKVSCCTCQQLTFLSHPVGFTLTLQSVSLFYLYLRLA